MSSSPRGYIGSSACLAVATFILVPSLLYQGGASTTGLAFGNFLAIALLFSCVATAVLSLVIFALRSYVDLRPWIAGLALAIVIKAALLPSSVPVLDGETSFVSFSSVEGVWSLVSIFLALAVAMFVSFKFKGSLHGPLLVGALAMSCQPLLSADNWTYKMQLSTPADVGPFMQFSRDKENVLVLLIDTFQSDVFAEVVESHDELREKFDGFTLFHNTVANAPYTLLAMMPIYSGRIYEGGSIRGFYETAKTDSIFSDFESMGYDTALGGWFFFGKCPASRCYNRWDFTSEPVLTANISKYIEVWDVSALRLAPTFLHGWIYNAGKGRSKALFPITDAGPSMWSVEVLKSLSEGLSATADKPTLKFVHVLVTHSPIILNADCEVGAEKKITRPNYGAQALCAVSRVTQLLEAMRANGLYDNTTIVLMADHGASISGEPPQRVYLDQVRAHTAVNGGRFNPLFSIKPKGASGPLRTSSAPLQPSDLRATLCGMMGGCRSDLPGTNAWNVAPESERSRSFIDYGAWTHRFTSEKDMLPADGIVKYTVGGSSEALAQEYKLEKRREAEPSK